MHWKPTGQDSCSALVTVEQIVVFNDGDVTADPTVIIPSDLSNHPNAPN